VDKRYTHKGDAHPELRRPTRFVKAGGVSGSGIVRPLCSDWVTTPGPAHTFLLMEKTLRNQAETPKTALISGVGARRRPGRAAHTVRPAHSPHRRETLEFALARGSHSSEVL
jgi:hypothetical protein